MGLRETRSRERLRKDGARGTSCRSLFAPETGARGSVVLGGLGRAGCVCVCGIQGPMTGLASSRIRVHWASNHKSPGHGHLVTLRGNLGRSTQPTHLGSAHAALLSSVPPQLACDRQGAALQPRCAQNAVVTSVGRHWRAHISEVGGAHLQPPYDIPTPPLGTQPRLLCTALWAQRHVLVVAQPGTRHRALLLTELPGLCLPGGHWATGLPRNPRRRGPQAKVVKGSRMECGGACAVLHPDPGITGSSVLGDPGVGPRDLQDPERPPGAPRTLLQARQAGESCFFYLGVGPVQQRGLRPPAGLSFPRLCCSVQTRPPRRPGQRLSSCPHGGCCVVGLGVSRKVLHGCQ